MSLSGLPPVQPVYLSTGAGSTFALFHDTADAGPGTPVLICPPFGWEENCSYRSREEWATELSASGHPTLRIDLPGTGDSEDPAADADLLPDWLKAVSGAAAWLSARNGDAMVAGIGIGLGGLLVCRAAAEGAPIDQLALWATPTRGRSFVRELRAFALLERATFERPGEPPVMTVAPDATGAGGFALNKPTVDSLNRLDLESPAPAPGSVRRALLLSRDGASVDARLEALLTASGADVSVAPGLGYAAMTAPPQDAVVPRALFATVGAWLDQKTAAERPSGRARPASAGIVEQAREMELSVDGIPVTEVPMRIPSEHGDLFGILARPHELPPKLCAVLLNAGMIHRTGPNRMWVDVARGWAARGVPTLRLDFCEIGDAAGEASGPYQTAALYEEAIAGQLRAAVDALQSAGMGDRFVLAGLCSGSYWSFQGALHDDRVGAAFMLNPRVLIWDRLLDVRRDIRRALLDPSQGRRLAQRAARDHLRRHAREMPGALASVIGRGLSRRAAAARGGDPLDAALDILRERDTTLLLAFSGEEPLQEELERQGRLHRLDRWPNMQLGLLPGYDHTLRQIGAQLRARAMLDEALERELSRPLPDRAPGGDRAIPDSPERDTPTDVSARPHRFGIAPSGRLLTSNGRPPRVLITNGEERSMLAVCRCLGHAGYDVAAASFTGLAPAHWSRSCRWRLRIVDACEDANGFVEALARELRKLSCDVLVPGSDTALLAISSQREQLEGLARIGLPAPAVIDRTFSREMLAEFASAAGLSPAESILCTSPAQAREAALSLGFPVVVKSAALASADGGVVRPAPKSRIVSSEAELAQALRSYHAAFLVQRCVPGHLLSIGGVIAGGRLLGVAVARYLRMSPPESGSVTFGETIPSPAGLEEKATELLLAMGWSGIFELELIEASPTRFVPIDLNPRPYGSMALAAAAGAPLAAIWCDWLLGRETQERRARPGVRYRWEDGELRHMRAQLQRGRYRAAAEVLRPHRKVVHAHYRVADPLPLLARAGYVARRLAPPTAPEAAAPLADGSAAAVT